MHHGSTHWLPIWNWKQVPFKDKIACPWNKSPRRKFCKQRETWKMDQIIWKIRKYGSLVDREITMMKGILKVIQSIAVHSARLIIFNHRTWRCWYIMKEGWEGEGERVKLILRCLHSSKKKKACIFDARQLKTKEEAN